MKNQLLLALCLGIFSIAHSQSVTNHPLKFNIPVEAQEFVIFHTDGIGNSTSSSDMTLGHYSNGSIIQDHHLSQTAPSQKVEGYKSMNTIALDYAGDNYDEVVQVFENANGFGVYYPFVNRNPLSTSATIPPNGSISTGRTSVDEPTIKLAKADFDGNGKEDLVIAYRKYNDDKIWIEIHKINGATHQRSLFEITAIQDFYPLSGGQRFEAFDITVNDFDGDGDLDLALFAVKTTGLSPSRRFYLYTYEFSNTMFGGLTLKGSQEIAPAGNTSGFENLAITSGLFDSTAAPQKQIALAYVYVDPNDNYTLHHHLDIAYTGSGAQGLSTISVQNTGAFSNQVSAGTSYPAIAITSGDLNNDVSEELVMAYDAGFQVFDVGNNSVLSAKGSGSGGIVTDDFYKLANNNSYISIGDADMDGENDILIVTSADDGNDQWLGVNIFDINASLSTITQKASNNLKQTFYSGFSSSYRFAACFGEFSGGRAFLREPTHTIRRITTPLIVNNAPPHHFDILDGTEVDLSDCFPTRNIQNCNMNSVYKEAVQTSSTLETTLNSDWGASGTLTTGTSVLGVGLKASVTAKYGEAFSNTQTNTRTVQVSTISTAREDDFLYAEVSDYDVFEYPVDSSNVIIGYVLALMRKDSNTAVLWTSSKSDAASGYIPNHEIGNLLSYSASSNFDSYNGVLDYIKEAQAGVNISTSQNSVTFETIYTDFTSSSGTETKTFGAEVSAEGSYGATSLEVNGTYNQSEINTHTTTAQQEITYTSNFVMALTGAYSDANYTITPSVFWANNGAATIGYAVDPTLPASGQNNFWSDHYVDKADLTLIMPWKYDPEKGDSLGSTPDKRRLCKSIFLNKPNFVAGDTIAISAYIQNYSFKTHSGPVEFQFYAGNPDLGGILLSDDNGQSTLTVNGPFTARTRTRIQFNWIVPAGLPQAPRIYLVIDPNDQIDEVHEENNVGWIGFGGSVLTGINETAVNESSFDAKIAPNPATDWTQVDVALSGSGNLKVQVMDMQGRLISTAYNNYLDRANYIIPIDTKHLQNGMYLVNIEINERKEVLRLIKLK